MRVEIAALCDAATDQAGKLNLLGAFDRMGGQLPLVIQQCAAAFRIRWDRLDAGEHVLVLSLRDTRGIPLVPPLESKIQVPEMPPHIESHAINLVLNLQRLRVDREGKYLMILTIDGVEFAMLPLWVDDLTPREPNPLQR